MPLDVRSPSDPVTRKIVAWCDALMDMSRRNPLLSLPKSSIPLTDQPDFLWNMPREGSKRLRLVSEKLPGTDVSRELKPGDRALSADQYRALKNMFEASQRSIREQGVSILFIATGIMKWCEPGRAEPLRSPVLLLPVDLERLPLDTGYFLSPRDDEARLNPTLVYRLMQPDTRVTLPAFADEVPGEYLASLIEHLPPLLGATLEPESVFLGKFSYLNQIMYEEIVARIEEARAHPLIAAIAGDVVAMKGLPRPKVIEPDTESPAKVFHVLSADPSQEEVIAAAREGANLVIQGPPGTGKTQTIANLIAACIADGKRVLFVSEKMAALKAVYSRLTHCGLGDLCLEAHSHKAGKSELLAQLKRAKSVAEGDGKPHREMDTSALVSLRHDFNSGVTALHASCEPLGMSLYEARSVVASLADVPDIFFALASVEAIDTEHLIKLEELTERFAGFSDLFAGMDAQPWRGLRARVFTQDLPREISAVLVPWQNAAVGLLEDTTSLEALLGLADSNSTNPNAQDAAWVESLAKQVLQTPRPLPQWLTDREIDLPSIRRMATATSERYQTFREQRSELLTRFRPDVLNQDHAPLIALISVTPRSTLATAFGDSWADITDDVFLVTGRNAEKLEDAIARLLPSVHELSRLVGVANPISSAEVATLLSKVAPCLSDFKPRPNWFFSSPYDLAKMANETKDRFEQRNAARATVSESFDDAIYRLNAQDNPPVDLQAMRIRFQNEYTGLMRVFKGSYWGDRKVLSGVLKSGAKLKDDDVPVLLAAVITVKDCDARLAADEETLRITFASHYLGEVTDWDSLFASLHQTSSLCVNFSGEVPDLLRDRMCASSSRWEEVRDQIELVRGQFGKLLVALERLEAQINLPVDVSQPKSRFPLPELQSRLETLRSIMAAFMGNRNDTRKLARESMTNPSCYRSIV